MMTTLVVISSLLYVHQHIEIVKASYILKDKEIQVAQLLDRNGALMYNIEKLESPRLLEEKLQFNNIVLAMPEKWHVVGSPALKKQIKAESSVKSKKGIFDFLLPKALAYEKSAGE